MGVSQGNGTGWSQAQLAHLDTDHCVSCKPLSLHLPKVSACSVTVLCPKPSVREEGACPAFRGCSQLMLVRQVGLLRDGACCRGACGQDSSGTRVFRQSWRGKDAQTALRSLHWQLELPSHGEAEVLVPDIEGNFRSSARAPLLMHATFSTWRESWPCNMLQAWTVAE